MFYKKSLFLFTSLVIAASSSIHASTSSEDDPSPRGAIKRQVSAVELFPNLEMYDALSFRKEQVNVVKNLEAREEILPKKIEKQESIKKEYKRKAEKYKEKLENINEDLISKISFYKEKRDVYKEKLENIDEGLISKLSSYKEKRDAYKGKNPKKYVEYKDKYKQAKEEEENKEKLTDKYNQYENKYTTAKGEKESKKNYSKKYNEYNEFYTKSNSKIEKYKIELETFNDYYLNIIEELNAMSRIIAEQETIQENSKKKNVSPIEKKKEVKVPSRTVNQNKLTVEAKITPKATKLTPMDEKSLAKFKNELTRGVHSSEYNNLVKYFLNNLEDDQNKELLAKVLQEQYSTLKNSYVKKGEKSQKSNNNLISNNNNNYQIQAFQPMSQEAIEYENLRKNYLLINQLQTENGQAPYINDLGIARRLELQETQQQQGNRAQPKQNNNDPLVWVTEGTSNLLQTVLNELGALGAQQDMDVHAFNKSFIAKHRGLFQLLVAELGLDINIADSRRKLLEHVRTSATTSYTFDVNKFNASIQSLNSYNITIADNETQIRIDHLMSALHGLNLKVQSLGLATTDYLVDSIQEGPATNGGCQPGWAGRFFRDIVYLAGVLKNSSNVWRIQRN